MKGRKKISSRKLKKLVFHLLKLENEKENLNEIITELKSKISSNKLQIEKLNHDIINNNKNFLTKLKGKFSIKM
jgi:Asp-tRNA(Asn)/Glu-tRNA(Gln) amidotransferase B subunit